MIPLDRNYVEQFIGAKVKVHRVKGSDVDSELMGVFHQDNDSYLVFEVQGQAVNVPLLEIETFSVSGGVVVEEEEEKEPPMTARQFASELDMLVDGVLSTARYTQLENPDYTVANAIDEVQANRNLTDEQSVELAHAVIEKQLANKPSEVVEEIESSPDVKEAISDAAVNEIVAELGLENDAADDKVADAVEEDKPLSKSQQKRIAAQQKKAE